MATVTAEALDADERAKLGRRVHSIDAPRISLAVPAGLTNIVALALLVGGTGTILAPAVLPFPGELLAIGAVALGGWLARGGGDPLELRAALARERAQLNRVLVAFALRGLDGPAGRSQPGGARAAAAEQREDDGVHSGSGPRALHPTGPSADESLELDADGDDLP